MTTFHCAFMFCTLQVQGFIMAKKIFIKIFIINTFTMKIEINGDKRTEDGALEKSLECIN